MVALFISPNLYNSRAASWPLAGGLALAGGAPLPPAADRVVAEMLTESIREAWEEAMPLQGDVSGTMHWMHAALQNQACEIENITEQK